jgi:hypothetical protein
MAQSSGIGVDVDSMNANNVLFCLDLWSSLWKEMNENLELSISTAITLKPNGWMTSIAAFAC